MAEIFLRTNKGSYMPGEILYGVIYLNVTGPISGQSVALNFQGHEKYNVKVKLIDDSKFVFKSGGKLLLDCDDVYVYKTDDGNPILHGKYMFPFQFSLLQDLPGSCQYSEGESFVEVKYTVQAKVVGCHRIKAQQEFFIIQQADMPVVANEIFTTGRHLHNYLRKKDIDIKLSIGKSSYSSDEQILLTIETKGINSLGPKTYGGEHRVLVKILQDITVTLPRPDNYSTEEPENSTDNLLPEHVPVVVEEVISEQTMRDINTSILEQPLVLNFPVLNNTVSTSYGKCVKCYYTVTVLFHFSGERPFVMSMRLPCIYQASNMNKQWSTWEPKKWVYGCTLYSNNHACAVHQQTLGSAAFAGFPGWQVF